MYSVCLFSAADLKIRNIPFPKKVSSNNDLPTDTYDSHLGLTWLSPKNIIYYCPGCSKSFASVGSVKNLLIDRINQEQNYYGKSNTFCLAILRLPRRSGLKKRFTLSLVQFLEIFFLKFFLKQSNKLRVKSWTES